MLGCFNFLKIGWTLKIVNSKSILSSTENSNWKLNGEKARKLENLKGLKVKKNQIKYIYKSINGGKGFPKTKICHSCIARYGCIPFKKFFRNEAVCIQDTSSKLFLYFFYTISYYIFFIPISVCFIILLKYEI